MTEFITDIVKNVSNMVFRIGIYSFIFFLQQKPLVFDQSLICVFISKLTNTSAHPISSAKFFLLSTGKDLINELTMEIPEHFC